MVPQTAQESKAPGIAKTRGYEEATWISRNGTKLIAQYRDGYAAIAEALIKITPEELDGRPGPGKWTVREIVHHLADSEMTAGIRLRRLLAEDRPEIKGYDQDEFARRLHYDRPHEGSLELFKAVRDSTAELLERMQPADWLREGTPQRSGALHAGNVAEDLRCARPQRTRCRSAPPATPPAFAKATADRLCLAKAPTRTRARTPRAERAASFAPFDFAAFNFQVPTSGSLDWARTATPTIPTNTAAAYRRLVVTMHAFLHP